MGVRELIQNAVDAVRERTTLKGPIVDEPLHSDAPDADVLVTVGKLNADQTAWLTVQDRGIGMTEEVINELLSASGCVLSKQRALAKRI